MRFLDHFNIEPGDTRDEAVEKMEKLLSELRGYAKLGYEHDATSCEAATLVNGDLMGGWVSPVDGKCSACGFYVGSIAGQVQGIKALVDDLKKKPKEWRFAIGMVPPEKKETLH